MIVRILGEAQYELDEAAAARLDPLDNKLDAAISQGDENAFDEALSQVLTAVRELGNKVEPTRIVPSDLALPAPGTKLAEARELLDADATVDS